MGSGCISQTFPYHYMVHSVVWLVNVTIRHMKLKETHYCFIQAISDEDRDIFEKTCSIHTAVQSHMYVTQFTELSALYF